MIYVTGDIHGRDNRINFLCSQDIFTPKDILIVCGDFGFIFLNNFNERMLLDEISEKLPCLLCFVDGNHENHLLLRTFETQKWMEGEVGIIRKNIYWLKRGEIYNIEGERCFCMGGGFSIDRQYRTLNYDYFEEEMPSEEEYQNARDNLERLDYNIDYIFSHTFPEESKRFFNHSGHEELPLNLFLEYVRSKTSASYKRWYFGHVHEDKEIFRNQVAVYRNVRNIETNEIIIE